METASARILVVDDDPASRRLLEVRLRSLAGHLRVARDGQEALQVVDAFRPDVILLDYMMPKVSGIEVIRRLKEDERFKSIPVILITARGSQQDKVTGLNAGADDYVVKPFEPFELLARVRSMLRIKQMHDALQTWNRTLEEKVSQQVAEIERMNRLKRYLAPQIADAVLQAKDEDLLKSHRQEITVVFLDLRGFTAFSDAAEPEEVLELLRSYHEEMGELIFKHEGTLEHFSGDGMMVFFNDPIPCERHTERAVRMALEMQEKAQELHITWIRKGFDVHLGLGLACGYATLGNIGFKGRFDYGAVGKVSNLAARLCQEAKGGQILTERRTLSKIEDLVEAELLGEIYLKGFARPIAAFNISKFTVDPRANR
jgi:class 3 adenylate cyclase/CheY-like chemotaxis protein